MPSTAAACSTSAIFITSDGWNVSGPAPSQRRAPLTSTPTPGIRTSTSMTAAAPTSSGVKRRAAVSPWREIRCMTASPTAPYATYLTRYAVPSPWPSSSVRADEAE